MRETLILSLRAKLMLWDTTPPSAVAITRVTILQRTLSGQPRDRFVACHHAPARSASR